MFMFRVTIVKLVDWLDTIDPLIIACANILLRAG